MKNTSEQYKVTILAPHKTIKEIKKRVNNKLKQLKK